MAVQHSPPTRQTKSRARAQDTEDSIWKEGTGPRRSSSFSGVVGRLPGLARTIFKSPGEDDEEEESEITEGASAPVGVPQGTGGPTIGMSHQP
ncbi:hypothetical protein O181_025298 [Austropuccinia psidii MF-1]|uniref:Uncharacterized protein n=1 Tax=Austropuccinia psidii MF-1 TaxID=1389203 RepID=A0A9Q3CKF2_9BASI|nr:hypothetical protein [Austropuccinia psidii MF-1]